MLVTKTIFQSIIEGNRDEVETLSNHEGVEIGSLFYYNVASVLSDLNKSVAFLKLPPEACLDGSLISLELPFHTYVS